VARTGHEKAGYAENEEAKREKEKKGKGSNRMNITTVRKTAGAECKGKAQLPAHFQTFFVSKSGLKRCNDLEIDYFQECRPM
jgi:hypothetical protein